HCSTKRRRAEADPSAMDERSRGIYLQDAGCRQAHRALYRVAPVACPAQSSASGVVRAVRPVLPRRQTGLPGFSMPMAAASVILAMSSTSGKSKPTTNTRQVFGYGIGAVLVAGLMIYALAPTWVAWLLLTASVLVLAVIGKPAEKPIIPPA